MTPIRDEHGRFMSPEGPDYVGPGKRKQKWLTVPTERVPIVVDPRPKVIQRKPKEAGTTEAILYGDTHHGYHCPKTLSVVAAVIRDLQPDVIVDMGDGVDAGALSLKFPQPLHQVGTIQDEIDAKIAQLTLFRALAPKAAYYYLEGNHEERLARMMVGSAEPFRALFDLGVVREALLWPTLLRLRENNIEWIPTREQGCTVLGLQLWLTHGSMLSNRSGLSAWRELTKYGMSGASGHTHRLGLISHRLGAEQHQWAETGCCCTLSPSYVKHPDWQNGFVSVTDTAAGLSMTPILVNDGVAHFRGKEYMAE